ncbi:hypothetical protein [Emticicia sp. TH156]|uniref:hypothetical protein n=1 Tax=Emticicia sp. TH156 TaxID=2067454 RepID=UPI000CB05E81|nr:hypothetical protein [Emticicia sp. TH156]PLK45551.1 hypothetical protein C0V77_05315 [Emticicia sp. TH156]
MAFNLLILSVFQSKWILYVGLVFLLIIQLWLLWRSKALPKKRIRIRLGLNLFVWLAVFLFVFQPGIKHTTNGNKILLVAAKIPKAYVQKIKDSLQIADSFNEQDFNRLISSNPQFVDSPGNVYLLGQNFSPKTLSWLSNSNLNWIPYFDEGHLERLRYKSIVKKGDMQELSGKLTVSKPQTLAIKYGHQTLDSLVLQKGHNTFHFSFPVFTIGRTEALLTLDEAPLEHIHFFAHAPQPRKVLFILGNPDFESKNLSEWLGRNNYQVEIITTIARDAQSKVTINKPGDTKSFDTDIIITDPANAAHTLVKKAVAEGKSVLFINCTKPEEDAKMLNQALGMNWRVKKISNDQTITVADNLTALPYVPEPAVNQKLISKYPIAIQKKAGSVGLSFLNETFQLKLSGDTLGYARIWSSVFQQLAPAISDNILIDAPVFTDTQTSIVINNPTVVSSKIRIDTDTTILSQSPVNPLTYSGSYVFRKQGWQSFQDSLSLYVEENTGGLKQATQIQEALQAHQQKSTYNGGKASLQSLTTTLPEWAWYLIILVGLVALWVEPKLN